MADTKWSLYKIVNGERNLVTGSETDKLVYTFPSNITDVVENYAVVYNDGDIHEEIGHNVLTGSSCVTQPTKCDCNNIGFFDDERVVTIEGTKNSHGMKKCITRNNCKIYYGVEGNDTNWLSVNLSNNTNWLGTISSFLAIGFTANTDTLVDRQAVISIYYDEEKQHKCDSFTVLQKARTKINVKWEVVLYTKNVFKKETESLTLNSGLVFNINGSSMQAPLVTGNVSANGYKSGSTIVETSSIQNLINTSSISDVNAKFNYKYSSTGSLGVNYGRVSSVGETSTFNNYQGTLTDLSECQYLKCEPSCTSECLLCLCGHKFVGFPSDYSGQGQINADGFDVLIRYEINIGACT